eukprot:COSAG01_NODE_57813_length_310_cov_0.293839_1_plen_68_part_01
MFLIEVEGLPRGTTAVDQWVRITLCCGQVEFQGLGCFMGKVTGVLLRICLVPFACLGPDVVAFTGLFR